MRIVLLIILAISLLFACKNEKETIPSTRKVKPEIINLLAANYVQLPEKEIAIGMDFRIYAQYAMPTDKYTHGILGDGIEAEVLVVAVDSIFYEYKLSDEYVFEDIRPRLFDVDGDSELEFITIRTHVSKGAGIAIYKIVDGQLLEYAHVPEIGIPYRWLNVVAIHDLDGDGSVELVWIETPHIGGILKVASINAGKLSVISEKSQYSNHAIGERNLCLSVLTEQSAEKVFYVPNQSRDKLIGFSFRDKELVVFEELDLRLDFSETLASQYPFAGVIDGEDNCIFATLE